MAPMPRKLGDKVGHTSRYRGVTLFAKSGRYQAFVKIAGVRHHCGMWEVERDAAIARDRAALHFGFATPLNEPSRAKKAGPASPDELRRLARVKQKTAKSSPYFGVVFNSARRRWDAFVALPGQRDAKWIAQFDLPIDAAVAYDRVAMSLVGPAAMRNFPDRRLAPATFEEMRRWSKELRAARVRVVGNPGKRIAEHIGVGRAARAGVGRYARDTYFAAIPGSGERVAGFDSERAATIARERMELAMGLAVRVSPAAKRLGPASAADLRRELRAARKASMSSRYYGVMRAPGPMFTWRARVKLGGSDEPLGDWGTEREAAIAVDRARLAWEEEEPDDLNLPRLSRRLGPATPMRLRREAHAIFKATTLSRYQGVTQDARDGAWYAMITVRGLRYYLGRFDDDVDAAKAYDDAAKRLGSKTAKLNFG